ncbi:PaaI family thioesterase [Streptomyces thermodiastaticus]
MLTGRLPVPPIAAALGFTLEEAEPGRVAVALVPGAEHYKAIGSVHGGVHATLLDAAAGCAVRSLLPQGTGYTSLDLTVKFLRPVAADTGTARAVGTVLDSGRRTALAQADLLDSADRLLAHATSSCMLFPVPQHRPDPAGRRGPRPPEGPPGPQRFRTAPRPCVRHAAHSRADRPSTAPHAFKITHADGLVESVCTMLGRLASRTSPSGGADRPLDGAGHTNVKTTKKWYVKPDVAGLLPAGGMGRSRRGR